MPLIRRLYRTWGYLEETVAVMLLIGITAIVLLQVFGRYILPNPYIWPEEVTRLQLVWLTFIGAAAVTRQGRHIAVDMIVSHLRPAAALLMQIATDLLLAVTFFWIGFLATRLAQAVSTLPLAATQWPMSVMVWPAAIGCFLIALHSTFWALGGATALATGRTRSFLVEAARGEVRT